MKKGMEILIRKIASINYSNVEIAKSKLGEFEEIRVLTNYRPCITRLLYCVDVTEREIVFKEEILEKHQRTCQSRRSFCNALRRELKNKSIFSSCTKEVKEYIDNYLKTNAGLLSKAINFDKSKLFEISMINNSEKSKLEIESNEKFILVTEEMRKIADRLGIELKKELEQKNVKKSFKKENMEATYMEQKILETEPSRTLSPEIEKYGEILAENGFALDKNFLYLEMEKKSKRIANFIPILTKKVKYINGIDEKIEYQIKAICIADSTYLPSLSITKKELNNFNFVIGSEWDKGAIIYGNNEKNLREVAQILSKETMKEEKIYTNTGFTSDNNNLVYLYHGGAIGMVEGIQADLTNDGLEKYSFTDKVFEEKQALQMMYELFELAEFNVIAPMIAITFLSPLTTRFQRENIFCDFAMFLQGQTGTRKSSLAAIMLSFFGNFGRNNFITTFEDTINNLEKKAYILKDTLLVLDDYESEKTSDKLKKMIRVTAMYGDRSGKGRMSANGTSLKRSYNARGCLIITGELIPDLPESRLARLIFVNITKDTVNLEKLTFFQSKTDTLAFGMMKYIEWIIKNEEQIVNLSKNAMEERRKKQNNSIHGRINEGTNCLYLGFLLFTEFLNSNEIIEEKEKNQLLDKFNNCLETLINSQSQEILSQSDPIEMFYDAIEEMLATEKIYLLNKETGMTIKDNSKGICVGYVDDNYYYLYKKTIYSKIEDFYGKNGFPLNCMSLLKTLQQRNLLYMTDRSRKTVVITTPISKQKQTVIKVKKRRN